MTNIIAIAILCCFFVNSGVVDNIKRLIWRWLKGKQPYQSFSLKPFDCELCLTWWSGLAYLLIVDDLSLLNVAIMAIVAWSTPMIVDIMRLLQELPAWAIGKIYDRLK